MSDTNRVDHNDPKANMYGILPCPKCSKAYRWPTGPKHSKNPSSIICDDCGFIEAIAPVTTRKDGE